MVGMIDADALTAYESMMGTVNMHADPIERPTPMVLATAVKHADAGRVGFHTYGIDY